MEFGPLPLEQALGAYLAHSTAGLRKGLRLDGAAIGVLREAGLAQVIVARLAPGDLHEDAAASRIADGLTSGEGLRIAASATGRVNLHATAPGVLLLDVAAIHALNRVNPMITLATLPPFQRVGAGDMVATVKIIAYGVPEADVTAAARAGLGALRLARPVWQSASLIETTTTAETPPPKGREALRLRLERLGLYLTERIVTAHAPAAIAAALREAPGEMRLILTASATSDPTDVAPEGLRQAGGDVVRFGMPVDPGNLLFFGALEGRPVIGLPGCARSPALNGADWVLERLACGLALSSDDIALMGVGGLLKEIPARGRLREA